MNEILNAPGVSAELYTLLGDLDHSWAVAFGEGAGNGVVAMTAQLWAAILQGKRGHEAGFQTAKDVLEHLVGPETYDHAAWWATPLGRAVAWWTGGVVDERNDQVPPGVVAGALGFTRQRASILQGRGRYLTRESLRAEMQQRWPL